MDIRSLIGIFALMMATYGCHQPNNPQDPQRDASIHCDATSGLCFRVDTLGASCPAQSWVARTEQPNCPEGITGQEGRWGLVGEVAMGGTARYCRYEWASDSATAPDAEALGALGQKQGLENIEPNCEVVSASAATIDGTWPELQRAFHEQIERVGVLPESGRPTSPVRVEIIDSAVTRRMADGSPSFGSIPHGRAMGLIVRNLACPSEGSCRAEIASTLALPLISTPFGIVRDEMNGGHFGSMADLAAAVNEAVDAWRADAGDRRLVINLSLGWEPRFGGNYEMSPQELAAPVRAVWDAIARARCLGAAVVAAAGNRVEGPDAPEGAIYPAAWANRSAPSLKYCHALGVTAVSEDFSSDAPLVFAVGGVEANDSDLGLGRRASRPELVAPAAHAVVADEGAGAHSTIQTGTSVAAAVTSAAAAVVWSYRPDLSADDIMALVYEGGADLGRAVNVCAGQAGCVRTAHRVSMCGALMQACANGEGACPTTMPTCERRPAGRVARPHGLRTTATNPVSARGLAPRTSVGWPCGGRLFTMPGTDVANPCPASQMPARSPFAAVGPQPQGGPPCPHCDYDEAANALYLEINPSAEGTLTDPVLAVVVDSGQPEVHYYDLSAQVPTLHAGDVATISDLDLGENVESATIEFLIDGQHSDRSPVIIW